MPKNREEKRTRSLRRNVPWQITVGAAFCATVVLCARKRRNRSKCTTTQPRASATTQIDKHFARNTSAATGSASLQLPPLPVLLVDEQLNCTAEQLWSIICQPNPKFQGTIHRLSGNRDIQYGSWSNTDGGLCREETYINPLKKNSLGPKEAFCLDQQRCIQRNSSGFVLERKVFTPKVPFGGSFHNKVLWCASQQPGLQRVRLQISCDVVYTGRFVPAKGIINSSSIEGMQRFYKMWLEQLHPFVDALGAAGKADAAPARRQKVSLQADSAASSQFFQHGKQPQASSQGITRAPVVLFLLALILWLLYNLVLLGRQNLLPHVSSAMSAGLKLLPPVLPLSTVAVEVANQTAIVLM